MTPDHSAHAAADSPTAAAPERSRGDHLTKLGWRKVDLFAPSALSSEQVEEFVDSAIRLCASEAGDFVRRISIGAGINNGDGWHRWCVYYLPGPPGLLGD
jgi:hypothetical protein